MKDIFEGTKITEKEKEKIIDNIIQIVQEYDRDGGINMGGVLSIIVDNSGLKQKMFTKKIYHEVEMVWFF